MVFNFPPSTYLYFGNSPLWDDKDPEEQSSSETRAQQRSRPALLCRFHSSSLWFTRFHKTILIENLFLNCFKIVPTQHLSSLSISCVNCKPVNCKPTSCRVSGICRFAVLCFKLSLAVTESCCIGYFLHCEDTGSPRWEDFILDHGLMPQSITGEEMAAGAGSSWSHSNCGQEAETCACWWSARFLLSVRSAPPPGAASV